MSVNVSKKFLTKTVAYLQDEDFDERGNLIAEGVPNDVPVLILLQSNFCKFSDEVKPIFQEFADENVGKVFAATIQGDGTMEGEAELSKRMRIICPTFRGFPDAVLFHNASRVDKKLKGRSKSDFEEFAEL
jgi:thiol-disulfide isomerase/thioredoxin